jgi:adenine-specific DNA-methyltransferase
MARKTRLELTWIGKEERPRLEPRILLEDKALSYRAEKRVTDHDLHDNRLIHGDNLLALKALEQEFAGKVKCIYIDPPYNTGSAFAQYDDGLEHSLWLSLMRDRLELLCSLLRDDGSIWLSIDDNEAHYLKVLCDEVFGRANFVANMIWEKRTTRENRRVFSFNHDHILVYAKVKSAFEAVRNPLPLNQTVLDRYKNPDNDPRGLWQSVSANAQAGHATASQFYDLVAPSGVVHRPPEGRCWLYTEQRMRSEIAKNNIWFGKDGKSAPRIKKFLRDSQADDQGLTPETLWKADEVGTNDSAKKHLLQVFDGEGRFDTPKPEELIGRIIEIATAPGEVVLDSFLGSGTTAAVAHKLRRRWIGIELGDHATTCCLPRLKKVAEGIEPGGISERASWQGGGGFRFFNLAPSLLAKDKWGNWIVSKDYHPEMLAEAMCKLEGFHYAPDPEVFWLHGKSTERDFIYVTTQNLSREQLQFISDQVGSDRTLLICCAAFRAKKDDFANLTVKKIPQAVLSRCEWGRDDYSLNVEELPPVQVIAEAKADASTTGGAKADAKKLKSEGRRKKPSAMQELPLFPWLDNEGNRK